MQEMPSLHLYSVPDAVWNKRVNEHNNEDGSHTAVLQKEQQRGEQKADDRPS